MDENISSKLVRFIPNYDKAKIFHYEGIERFDSTFAMHSLAYYQTVENLRIQDSRELSIVQNIGGEIIDREDIQSYYYLVSCWSLYAEINFNELSRKFIDELSTNGIAVISTIERVDKLIKKITEKFNQPTCRYKNGRVEYYAAEADEDIYGEHWSQRVALMKRDIYKNEHEYRFLFDIINLEPTFIKSIIFNVKSQDYIDQIIDIRGENPLLKEFCLEKGITYSHISMIN